MLKPPLGAKIQIAEGPGEPSDDEHPDTEAFLGASGRTEDVEPSGLFKDPHYHSREQPPKQEDVSRRPADSIQEEDRGQRKPQEARNQMEAHAEAGHALESLATPDLAVRT
ncbi:hypothetical protein NDU88_005467 [Pleurodeles waltl]|uniref:Uncharacterized protein n=1 Tax=Pleurodeles waltl TaxID=8319 RepID=A0AAV7WDG6_PLEWA|nr:hypothetical protein NDU88_005467 [Pleurodeles waltl]